VKGYGLFYYIAEAFRGLRANSLVNVLALGTITMIMLIVGFFLLVFFNLQASVQVMGERLEVSVYLKDGLTEHEKDFLQSRLKAEPGIRKVTYLSKEQALEVFKKELKGQEALLEGLGQNPLPDSYEVNVDRSYAADGRLEALSSRFSGYPGVEDVSYGRHGAEVLGGLLKLIGYGGTAIALLLGVSVVFIISNSVRLALYSRGQEIELMQWIGATRGFIQGPFLIEGMLLAMLGTALSIGILAGLYYALPHEAVLFLSRNAGLDFLPPPVVASMIAGGGLLGFAGGMVSIGKFLE
jgi:cell division transport system permease protein